MTHLHFTRRSPFSRQKSSLNGPDTAWAEGRYNTHPQHHCRSRGACTAHIVHKWSPHSRYNQAWPPCDPSAALAAHTRSMIAFGLQSFARLQSSAQPPCLQTELLLYYSHRREQPGPLPYQFGLPPWSLPACWLPGFLQSMATGGWKVRRRLWLPCCCQR